MCSGAAFPAWQAQSIVSLVQERLAAPVLLIVDTRSASNQSHSLAARLRSKRLAWNIYGRLFVNRTARSTAPVNLEHILGTVPRIHCTPRTEKGSGEYFDDKDVAQIGTHRLDFILRFAFGI